MKEIDSNAIENRGGTRLIPPQEFPSISSKMNLILVPCHTSLWQELPPAADLLHAGTALDDAFALWSYQTSKEIFQLRDHILEAVKAAALDDSALLVFSGGRTHRDALTEADSYLAIGKRLGEQLFEETGRRSYLNVASRMRTDTAALSTFHNVFGAMAEVIAATGYPPNKISVYSWKFKEERVMMHFETARRVLGIEDALPVSYFGINNPEMALERAEADEARTREAYLADPYGARGDLRALSTARNVDGIDPASHYMKKLNIVNYPPLGNEIIEALRLGNEPPEKILLTKSLS